MDGKPKNRSFGAIMANLAGQFAASLPKQIDMDGLAGAGRPVWSGVARKKWLGHKQTIWVRDLNTGRLKVGGHDRYQ